MTYSGSRCQLRSTEILLLRNMPQPSEENLIRSYLSLLPRISKVSVKLYTTCFDSRSSTNSSRDLTCELGFCDHPLRERRYSNWNSECGASFTIHLTSKKKKFHYTPNNGQRLCFTTYKGFGCICHPASCAYAAGRATCPLEKTMTCQ